MESLHVILHITAANDWCIKQYDVKTAFLYRILPKEETQFMEQPPEFTQLGKEAHIWELHHGLYGMCQSLRIWNCVLNALFLGWGFLHSECKWCIYLHHSDNGNVSTITIHVNNMVAISSNESEADQFQSELESTWQITTLGEPKLVVSIAIHCDRKQRTIMLSQTALIDKIVSTYRQSDTKPASTPIAHSTQLIKPDPQSPLDKAECE